MPEPKPTMLAKDLGVLVYGRGHADYIDAQLSDMVKRFNVQFVTPGDSRDKVIARFRVIAKECHIHVVLFAHPLNPGGFDEKLLGVFVPHLRLVAGMGAGFDHVDTSYLNSIGVIYANTPNAVSDPTAITTIQLIFQTIRASSQAEAVVRRGEWRRGLTSTPDIRDLTIGIVGMGSIGKLVQRKLDALGYQTIYHNRRQLSPAEEGSAEYVSFDELIRTADVITLHCPLTSSTRHLLSDAQFDMMKDGVFIVNTSRGAVIDEKALVRAMKSGKVSRVGLDVFEREPEIDPYLLESECASLLPHWATHTKRTQRETEREMIANFSKWLQCGRPNTQINEPAAVPRNTPGLW